MKVHEIYEQLRDLRARIRWRGHTDETRAEVRRLGDLAAKIFAQVSGDPEAAFSPEVLENRRNPQEKAFFHHPHVIEDVCDYAVRRGFADLEISADE